MSDLCKATKDEMLADLAAKDPFFSTSVAQEKSRITGAFETAAWESCPHIVTVLHRQGNDYKFNGKVTEAMHRHMNLPPTLVFSGIISKRSGINGSSVDWTDTRMKYGFSNPAAALAFATAMERDFSATVTRHTIVNTGPDRRVFTPHSGRPQPE